MRRTLIPILILVGCGYFLWDALSEAEQIARKGIPPRNSDQHALPRSFQNSLGMSFVLIPIGEFLMGSSVGTDEKPAHRVHITRHFYMGIYEVTQGQWQKVMGTSLEEQRNKANPEWGYNGVGDDDPMYYVSWNEAQTFLQRLNTLEGVNVYRLPTEAEWEYACRAGATEEIPENINLMAWYGANSGEKTHPVGQKQPNAWGLYDMHGNVWEWCQDWFGMYSEDTGWDPKGPETGTSRIVRGGSWLVNKDGLRSASRVLGDPEARNGSVGFRVAVSVK